MALHTVCWCLPSPTTDFGSCDRVWLGLTKPTIFTMSPFKKQIKTPSLNPKISKAFKLPNLNPLSHTLHQLNQNSNSHICKSLWISTIHARGGIDLNTFLTLMGKSSFPLHIQRPFLHLSLLPSVGSANPIPFTFCCRLFFPQAYGILPVICGSGMENWGHVGACLQPLDVLVFIFCLVSIG